MAENDCGCIPVLDSSDSNKPAGVVADRDICCRVIAEGEDATKKQASDAMTRDTVTISPDSDVEEAARLMREKQVRRLLVVDDRDEIVGIVAQADLAREASDKRTGRTVDRMSQPSSRASRVGTSTA